MCVMAILSYFFTIECVIGYRDCKDWLDLGHNQSGIYPINPDGGEPFQVGH